MERKQRITFCQMTLNSIGQTIECIKRLQPYVDRVVIIDGGSTDGTIETLRSWEGVELYIHPWTTDDFSKQRNICLKHCGENGGTDFILFTDPDELVSEDAAKNLQKILAESALGSVHGLTLVRFRCRDVTLRGIEVVMDKQTNFFKPILFRHHPDSKYSGNIHEGLKLGMDGRETQTLHEYSHIKQELSTPVCGTRNLFLGGGIIDNESKEDVMFSKWSEFVKLIKDTTGIDKWNDFNKYLIAGNIDKKISDLIAKNKDEKGYEGASCWIDMYLTYFRIYHPEEESRENYNFQWDKLPWCASAERQEVSRGYQDFIDGKNPGYVEFKDDGQGGRKHKEV